MRLKRLFRPRPHLERHAAQHALLVAIGAWLAVGALVGVAWAAGFDTVFERARHVNAIWLPVAFGFEVAAKHPMAGIGMVDVRPFWTA